MARKVIYDADYIRSRSVVVESGCWEWQGSVGTDGYGSMNAKSCGEHNSHRLSFRIHKGDIPQNKIVLHKCDNRLCCNPDHLHLGWHSDNTQDALTKGRRDFTNILADASKRRLSQDIADEIVKRSNQGQHYETIAKDLNISRSTAHKYSTKEIDHE